MAYIEGEIPTVVGNNGGYGSNGFFGSDGIWAILLFAMIFGWGNNGNFGGGFGGGYGNMLYDINANTNRGFDQAAIVSGLNGIQGALSDASVARCNSTTTLLQAINGGFADTASAFQQCLTKSKKPIKDFATNLIAVGTCAA